jgi:error-prone DNA polymerase
MPYAELHCHSAYSFLDGASMPDELVPVALELGYDALALTDHNSLSGSMELAQAARGLGLRAIHGAELDVACTDGDRRWYRHLTLLVEDARGWSNLSRLITRAHAHTRQGRPGAPPSDPCVGLDDVLAHAEGLVCLTGCAARGIEDEATGRRLLHAFGRDRLRVELQRPFHPHDRACQRSRRELARRLEVRCVATGNVHAHARSRAPLQDALVAVRHHTTLDACEPRRRGNWSHVLASPAAMAARFDEHPDAVAESARLAERLRFDLLADLGYRYPGAEDAGADRALAECCRAALHTRYADESRALREEATARLEEELRVIQALGLAGFFLLHRDLLELAREVAVEVRGPDTARALLPPGRGRGSSVSSIVCFLTGLSHVDPIRNQLLLGRFLNEELTALPDIDLDFPRDIRETLIPRVHERYGHERSALVAAFPTYRARGAIRDLGKALGLPPGEIERVARGSNGITAKEARADVVSALGEHRAASGRWPWLVALAAEAHGLPRHLSQHPGGMIVSTRPLVDCCPVVPAAMEGRQIAQWDKDSCADAGFLKIDLLGLGMLSAVERCVELIARTRGESIDLSRIPYDDPPTYAAIQAAETTGVFQIESRAQMQSLRRTRPETLDDLTIQVAIVRPGPIQGGAVNPYIERRQRLRADPGYAIPCLHASLEPVLRDTLGTIIFQDQVIEVAMAFAGFSAGQAEGLRRAMSRRRSEAAMERYHRDFVTGALERDVEPAVAEAVWTMVKGFSGFGFPKAHGAAFGLLAYQSTWLRVHYGAEFLCSLLNEQPMGFYPPDTLAHESQRRGIEVRGVDVNASEAECTVEVDEHGVPHLRIGLGYVGGVRAEEVQALVAARRRIGPFRSAAEVAAHAGASRSSLELLAWAGACDGLGGRRAVLWQLGVAAWRPEEGRRARGGVQLALPMDVPPAPELPSLGAWEKLLADYAGTGMTLGEHPLSLLRPSLPPGVVTSHDLQTLPHGARVRIGGLVVARQRPGTANGMVFILLEDEHGTINLVVPPPVYERHRLTARTEPLVLATGTLERPPSAGGAISVLIDGLASLDRPDLPLAEVKDLPSPDERERPPASVALPRRAAAATGQSEAAAAAGEFRAVAPAVQSFASGRRR